MKLLPWINGPVFQDTVCLSTNYLLCVIRSKCSVYCSASPCWAAATIFENRCALLLCAIPLVYVIKAKLALISILRFSALELFNHHVHISLAVVAEQKEEVIATSKSESAHYRAAYYHPNFVHCVCMYCEVEDSLTCIQSLRKAKATFKCWPRDRHVSPACRESRVQERPFRQSASCFQQR